MRKPKPGADIKTEKKKIKKQELVSERKTENLKTGKPKIKTTPNGHKDKSKVPEGTGGVGTYPFAARATHSQTILLTLEAGSSVSIPHYRVY